MFTSQSILVVMNSGYNKQNWKERKKKKRKKERIQDENLGVYKVRAISFEYPKEIAWN